MYKRAPQQPQAMLANSTRPRTSFLVLDVRVVDGAAVARACISLGNLGMGHADPPIGAGNGGQCKSLPKVTLAAQCSNCSMERGACWASRWF